MKHLPFLFLFGAIILSCSDDDSQSNTLITLSDNVEVYNGDLIENGYVLAVEHGSNTSYLLNKEGLKIHEWTFEDNLGNDLEILPNGKLLGIFKSSSPEIAFGGFGGILRILNSDGTTDWEYIYASETSIAHHDVELLPNGNVLFIAWERIGNISSSQAGADTTVAIFPEVLIEINPNTNQTVWEWHSFDHIIQDRYDTLATYGNVSDNPQLIDINYNIVDNGDIMHANGIDYDAEKDVIYLSINYYNEVWVIDHSTTTAEAATNSGGNYNKGGDLLYRFGNPEAYKNTEGERLFYNNHFPNLLEGDEPGAGNVLVYGNGNDINQSTVFELDIPNDFSLLPNTDNEPSIVWSFTDPNLFFGRISGAVRLKNGNTLIAEGDYGLWEVTPNHEIVWKYNGQGVNFWRCYGYLPNDESIVNLDLL
ncbi:arylsulfotransferase ASST [Winogradskyella pacifica]|uniref:Arylsulfotransferase ASST n=1 Tax=Winogradskyella pacifica TaxID=664642 RepID=A0A3D9LLC7_9FLAO|nr:aryl-sulfate sulfotransferase [Winogradskyella pacifica]REE08055.1 arylsulfotransferase ASST [Winogradskyella pacifica]